MDMLDTPSKRGVGVGCSFTTLGNPAGYAFEKWEASQNGGPFGFPVSRTPEVLPSPWNLAPFFGAGFMQNPYQPDRKPPPADLDPETLAAWMNSAPLVSPFFFWGGGQGSL